MTIYYLTTKETYYKDYKVEAESKEEAESLVMNGQIDHYQGDWAGDQEVDFNSVCTEEEELS